ncbi:MAG: histidine kinase [Chloroflexia bacterium]|nr:histidine kinase [Chloroflexia bacterium]
MNRSGSSIINIRKTLITNLILILLSSALVLFFRIKINAELISKESFALFILIYLNLKFGIWFGAVFFDYTKGKLKARFSKTIIIQLLAFYVIVFLFSLFILFAVFYALNLSNGQINITLIFSNFFTTEVKPFILYYSIGILLGSIIFFYLMWKETLTREQKLKEEKLIFKYETLKNQVNPHFLFNSLNTLSSLVYSNPELSEEFITKLSSIYRYILENKDAELITLKKELNFAKDYFYLQQIRDGNKINLSIELNNFNFNILPISLQILIENAIKHNIASRDMPLNIRILQSNNDYVVVENNLQEKNMISDSTGLGLTNLAERMRLITNREVIVNKTTDKFFVSIPLVKTS